MLEMEPDEGVKKERSWKNFMKLTTIVIVILLAFFIRGLGPGIVITSLLIFLWLLVERVMAETESPSHWRSNEKREDFSRLPLGSDINKMKGAKKGQKVKQAILEGRLKEQVYNVLKNDYNLSEEEIEDLEENLDDAEEKIDNEALIEYLKNSRDLNDLKTSKGEDLHDIFSGERKSSSDGKKLDFEEKIEPVVEELEKIYHTGKEG